MVTYISASQVVHLSTAHHAVPFAPRLDLSWPRLICNSDASLAPLASLAKDLSFIFDALPALPRAPEWCGWAAGRSQWIFGQDIISMHDWRASAVVWSSRPAIKKNTMESRPSRGIPDVAHRRVKPKALSQNQLLYHLYPSNSVGEAVSQIIVCETQIAGWLSLHIPPLWWMTLV